MPRYDYRCSAGHTHEAVEAVNVGSRLCPICERLAARVAVNRGHLPGVAGFVSMPTRERGIPLNRFIEAQSEIIHTAERHGIEPPNLLQVAHERIARGDVKAIEG